MVLVLVVVVQGTCRPAVLSLDSNAVRSCTWPRAPALRRPRPDNRRLRGGGPAGWGRRDGRAPLAHPAGPTAVTRGSPNSPHPPQPPFWSAARSGAVTSSDGAVTSSDGALVAPEAMAVAPGPREESAERRRLLRAVTRLQVGPREAAPRFIKAVPRSVPGRAASFPPGRRPGAEPLSPPLCPQAGVRGFLLRRRLRDVRAEYEEVVREIEGELSELRWTGLCLPRPVFVSEVRAGAGRAGVAALCGRWARRGRVLAAGCLAASSPEETGRLRGRGPPWASR